MATPKKTTDAAATPAKEKGPTTAQLAEAIRRVARGNIVTEEQLEEVVWLTEGKDPEKERERRAKKAAESSEG